MRSTLLPLLVAGVLAAADPLAQERAAPEQRFTVGSSLRRDFALPVLDGAEEPVPIYGPPGPFDEKLPVVVLAFWSLRDPLSRVAERKLEQLAGDFADRGVRIFLIESNHDELVSGSGDPLAKIRAHRERESLTLPLLSDRGKRAADELAAVSSNQVLVFDPGRTVRYVGGIDDDPREDRRGEVEHWLAEAIELALEGRGPEQSIRRAQGRPIKRAPPPPAPAAPPRRGGGAGEPDDGNPPGAPARNR